MEKNKLNHSDSNADFDRSKFVFVKSVSKSLTKKQIRLENRFNGSDSSCSRRNLSLLTPFLKPVEFHVSE